MQTTAKADDTKNNNSIDNSRDAAETVDQLRSSLCEVMAEMLLSDAKLSWQYKVVERLFNQCFYIRIAPQRLEIAKKERRNPQVAENLQAFLNRSLHEAIPLYEYLTKELENKLLVRQRGDTTIGSGDDAADGNLEFIVPLLQSLYVNLGDLHRYANELPQALNMYERAVRLGPGHGHAYNQIAVYTR
jgi:tetratricopeptide (TPR) repeat protein